MPELNETPEPSASDSEQPEAQAVESASVEAPAPETQTESTETSETPRMFAGKYKTVEELEQGYQAAQSEASRMASELARGRTVPAKTDDRPKYSQEQLETWKEGRIREVAQLEAQAARLQQDGNYRDAQQAQAQAQESARQIRLIDGELRQLDIKAAMQSTTRQSAEQRLMTDANEIIRQHAADLVPGTTLYNKAEDFLNGFVAMGMDKESPLVQAQAVAMAAQVLGLTSKKSEQGTRKAFAKTISDNLKQGVVSGGSKAVKAAASPNFDTMSDAEFAAYKKARGWD